MLGVGLGCIMVYFIFGDRELECSYFPNDRVLYDLRKKEIKFSPSAEAQRKDDPRLDSALIWMLDRGDVDFEASNTKLKPCKVYLINLEEPAYQFKIENCDSVATVLEAQIML